MVIAAGCKQSKNQASFENLKDETRKTYEAAKDYTFAQRAEFAVAMKVEIAKLNEEITELGVSIEKAGGSARAEAKAKLQTLRQRVADLNLKTDAINNATESTWDALKSGVKQGYSEATESFRQARVWLSEKIAP